MTHPTHSTPHCLVCERPSTDVPLILLRYGSDDLWICPQHLPILIHRPHDLIGRLPGAENLEDGHHD